MKAGSMMVVGFEGVTLPERLKAFYAEHGLGGVILFERNCPDGATVKSLCAEIEELDSDILVMVDQEGGRVERIKEGVDHLPPARELAALEISEIEEASFRQATQLLRLGVHINLAPVCDVVRAHESGAIGDRAFGEEPYEVIKGAVSFYKGMARAGMPGVAKHFPGHGAAQLDTHTEVCVVDIGKRDLEWIDMITFRNIIAAGIEMVMASHLVFPVVDDKPVSLSGKWINETLRGHIGFSGVVITDDMEMAAACSGGHEEAALGAVEAGCDLLIYGAMLGGEADIERIASLIAENVTPERIATSVERVDKVRARYRVA